MNINKEDVKIIQDNKATLIGYGEWIKDDGYRVYQVDDRYIAIIVSDWQNHWLDYEGAIYIDKKDIDKYMRSN